MIAGADGINVASIVCLGYPLKVLPIGVYFMCHWIHYFFCLLLVNFFCKIGMCEEPDNVFL
jgi:hypothetical protein